MRETKKVSDSLTEQQYLIRPSHINHYGRLFGGQLMEWIDEYNGHASLEDLEKGFLSMELLSFSGQEIRVRKRIESMKEKAEQIEKPEQIM